MDRSADNLGQVISGIQRDLEELKSSQGSGSGGGGGGGGEEYYAGDGITISNNTISADTNVLATKTDLTDYAEISDLATVATSGSYNDLTNKPTIPAAQVNSDWNASSGVAEILNKPNLATVATSGSYNDLSNKPTIPTVNNGTLTIQKNGTTVQTFTANQSTAATANISVPTKTSDITNDSGFATYSGDNICGQGKNISLSTPANAPLASFQLDGETSQNGTPTPSAPVQVNTTTGENVVKICGKNLFNKSTNYNNSTIDAANGNIGSNSNFLTIWAECQPNTTYTISKGAPTTRFVVADSTKIPQSGDHCNVLDGYNSQSTSKTITTSSSAKYLIAMVKSGQDTLSQQAILDFMQIELGSTATEYQPYQGQSYEVNLGKNLCDLNATFPLDINGITVTKEADGSVTFNGTLTSSTNITLSQNNISDLKFLQGQVATLSFSTSGTGSISNIGLKQSGASVFETSTSSKTVTVDFGTKTSTAWQAWCLSGTVYNNFNLKVQLEKGSQATSYAAYFEPIELCKIGDYQDYIYKSGDKWYLRKEVGKDTRDVAIAGIAANNTSGAATASAEGAFLMFSGDWGNDYSTTAGQARFSSNIGKYKLDANITGNTGARAMESGTFCQRQGTNDRIYFRNTALIGKTGNEVKALLEQSGGSNFYYPLATATEGEITNATLIAQLNALLTTARTYAGINNIFTITPNEQGTLEMCFKGGIASPTLMAGCSATTNGLPGLVPAPAAGDEEKYLRGDGTWQPAGSSSSIPDGAVTTPKLASKAVTTAKIDDGAVTNAQIANSTIAATKINWSTFKYNFTATTDGAGFIVVPTDVVNKTTGFILSARCPGSRYAFALVFSDADTNNNRYTLCIKSWDMSNVTNQSVEVDILYCLA